MPVSDIYNFVEVSDAIATSGQPSAAHFHQAREEGYQVVVNLAPDGLPTSLAEEQELVGELGLDYYHLPVPWDEPTLDLLDQFERLMTSLKGRRTLIHCQANYRVTAFFGSYAVAHLGWPQDRADALINQIWTSRPGFQMDDKWKDFLSAARQRSEPKARAG
jgi:protein tyrosine phosphatase (PTP) superfamily phosphohydrolase (DUF442 family)